jgi:hypothetical protein
MFDFKSLIKYLLEGFAVGVSAFLIPKKKLSINEIVLIALTAAAIFATLDLYAPTVGISARQGAGFSIGFQQIGFGESDPDDGMEGYDDYGYEREDFHDKQCDKKKHEGICKMNGDVCTYDPSVKDEKKNHFVCQKTDGQCDPIKACKHTPQGCEMNDKVKDLSDAKGRSCQLVHSDGKKKCELTSMPPSTAASGSIEGFEGFSKTF